MNFTHNHSVILLSLWFMCMKKIVGKSRIQNASFDVLIIQVLYYIIISKHINVRHKDKHWMIKKLILFSTKYIVWKLFSSNGFDLHLSDLICTIEHFINNLDWVDCLMGHVTLEHMYSFQAISQTAQLKWTYIQQISSQWKYWLKVAWVMTLFFVLYF